MSAKKILLSKNGVSLYPQTIDEAIAVVKKSKLLSTVLAELGAEDARLAMLIANVESNISVLNGSDEGSVNKKIADAIDAFSTQVTDDGTINTVKELFDYVAEHGSDFNALLGSVSANETNITGLQSKVQTLESDNTNNKANIASNTEAVKSLNIKVGSSADNADDEGSLYARIAKVKNDLSTLLGNGGTISEQINSAIEDSEGRTDDKIATAKQEAINDAADDAKSKADAVQDNLDNHIDDEVRHITAAEREVWNAKIDYIELEGTYPDFTEIISSEA